MPGPFYRKWVDTDLIGFRINIQESDMFILAEKELSAEARGSVNKYRKEIQEFIDICPDFLTSLVPLDLTEKISLIAPPIVKKMMHASKLAGVGPMAAVAGAIAEFTGYDLMESSDEIIVENGGDIFMKSSKERLLSIFAGDSPLSGKIGLVIQPGMTPLGVATSSGTVGHSLSFGSADSVSVLSPDASIADAAATAVCNMVKTADDIAKALEFSKSIEGVTGCVIIYNEKIGSIGDIELTRT